MVPPIFLLFFIFQYQKNYTVIILQACSLCKLTKNIGKY